MTTMQQALEGTRDELTRYERVYAYAQAYELQVWSQASGHAWDRLEAIAQEYERGEYAWERAAELVDDTVREIYA